MRIAHDPRRRFIKVNVPGRTMPLADSRDGVSHHEWTVWEGEAADKAEALKCAEKADPRVDLEWVRIRYEQDLDER